MPSNWWPGHRVRAGPERAAAGRLHGESRPACGLALALGWGWEMGYAAGRGHNGSAGAGLSPGRGSSSDSALGPVAPGSLHSRWCLAGASAAAVVADGAEQAAADVTAFCLVRSP